MKKKSFVASFEVEEVHNLAPYIQPAERHGDYCHIEKQLAVKQP